MSPQKSMTLQDGLLMTGPVLPKGPEAGGQTGGGEARIILEVSPVSPGSLSILVMNHGLGSRLTNKHSQDVGVSRVQDAASDQAGAVDHVETGGQTVGLSHQFDDTEGGR